MAPAFDIVDDAIVPHGGSFEDLTPRETNVRNAMFFITVSAPIIGSFLVWLFSKRGWTYASSWSFARLVIIWFLSVATFGALVFFQRGRTTRITFMLAILHEQIELLINALLLKATFRKSLLLAGLWGTVLYLNTIVAPTMASVFFPAAILGGANDLVIPFLFAYGKKWLYALGGLFHVLSAIIVFTESVIFLDVVTYNALIFITLFGHVSITTWAVLRDSHVKGEEYIALPASPRQERPPAVQVHTDNYYNPLKDVDVPKFALIVIIGVSLASSTITTVLLYIFA